MKKLSIASINLNSWRVRRFNMLHPRSGTNKKFTAKTLITAQDIAGQLINIPYTMECKERNPALFQYYGRMKGLVWYIQRNKDPAAPQQRKEEIRAVQLLYEAQLGRRLNIQERLKQTCKTKGCMNPSHYVIRNRVQLQEKAMLTKDQVRAIYETALQQGSVTIPVNNEIKAKRLRLAVYTHKRKLAQEYPSFGKQMEDYELVVRNGNLVCQRRGIEVEQLLREAGLPETSQGAQEDAAFEQAMAEVRAVAEQQKAPADRADTTLRDVGYAPKSYQPAPAQSAQPTYDEVYAKAAAGQTLTPEEEAILNDGPPPEPAA